MITTIRCSIVALAVSACGAFPNPAQNRDAATSDSDGPFAVASVSPADSSMGNTASGTTVSATFSANLECSSITTTSLQVLEDTVPVSGQLACAGTTLTFQPMVALPTNTTLQVTIDQSVKAANGATLESMYSWTFGMSPWTRQLGTAVHDFAFGIAIHGTNLYVSGRSDGDFDGNTNAGTTDVIVLNYDAKGAKVWARQLGTAGQEDVGHVAKDANGNAYVAGWTQGDLDGSNSGGIDIFVAKYDPSGTRQWIRQLGNASSNLTAAVACDQTSNVFVVGTTGAGLDGQPFAGMTDAYVVKYNTNGVKQWTRQLGTTAFDGGTGVATDSAGNVYVGGYTDGGLDGNTSAGLADLFVTKYDPNGVKQWTRQLGSTAYDGASTLTVDPSGNIYVLGGTQGNFDGNTSAGSLDAIVVKYDSGGVKRWSRQFGSASDDSLRGAAADQSDVYIVGETTGGIDGNVNAGDYDAFVIKYDVNGVKQWTRQFGTNKRDDGYGVAISASGGIFVVGDTQGALDGNANVGLYDLFILQYEKDGRKR